MAVARFVPQFKSRLYIILLFGNGGGLYAACQFNSSILTCAEQTGRFTYVKRVRGGKWKKNQRPRVNLISAETLRFIAI